MSDAPVGAVMIRILSILAVLTPSAHAFAQEASAPPIDGSPAPIDRVVFALSPGQSHHRSVVLGYAGTEERLRLAVSGGPSTPVPKIMNGTIVACAGASLYFVDAVRAVVRKRVLLPGECTALFVQDGEVTVRVTGGDVTPWTRYIAVPENSPPSMPFPRIALMLAQHQVAMIAPGSNLRTYAERRAALRDPENRDTVAQSERELMRRESVDTTNPWYAFELGMIAHARGDSALAHACFLRALSRDRAYDLELMRMVTPLDHVDEALADRAFARGYAYLVAHGYVPELATSALTAVILLGVPDGAPVDATTHYDMLSRHAKRLMRLAPHAEGSASFYEALRREALNRGNSADAALFTRLTSSEKRNRTFGIAAWEARFAGDLINAMIGFFFAFVLLTVLKTARTLTKAPAEANPVHRFSPLSRWTRAERLGVVIATIVFCTLGTWAARGVALIGQYASSPTPFAMGLLGDPETVAYTRDMTGAPGGDLIHAIALIGAGQRERARPFLERSRLPEARTLLTSTDTGTAIHIGTPLAAALDEAHRMRLYRKGPSEIRNPVRATIEVFAMASGDRDMTDMQVVVLFVFALCFFALLGPYDATPWPSPTRPTSFIASLFVPGAPRAYGALSFVLGGAFISSMLALIMYRMSDGLATNMLDAIAVPEVSRYYGIATRLPPDALGLAFYAPGALVLMLHVVYVAFFARRSDDPARGLEAAKSDTAAVSSETSSPP